MTYLRRAIKYFIQTCLLLAIILGILMLSGMVSKDITVAFTHGWTSVWWILAIFAGKSGSSATPPKRGTALSKR